LITERTGPPLSVGICGADVHDSQALIPLAQGGAPSRYEREAGHCLAFTGIARTLVRYRRLAD
jgi:hypothetical protein